MKQPVNVAITGAAGQIGYALAFRVASGQMLGADQPINLHLLEITRGTAGVWRASMMELNDCAFPTLTRWSRPTTPRWRFATATRRCWWARGRAGRAWSARICCSPTPRSFRRRARRSMRSPNREVRVLVVGNPANTNALIAQRNAPDADPAALHRDDASRSQPRVSQLAEKTGTHVSEIRHMTIWGNHSATQYPDISHAPVAGKRRRQSGRPEMGRADLHPHRAAARRRGDQGARLLVGGLGRIGSARSHAHLVLGHAPRAIGPAWAFPPTAATASAKASSIPTR